MVISSKTEKELDDSTQKENLKLLEAVLFVSGRFLSANEIANVTDFSSVIIFDLIDKLKEKYNEDSAIEIVEKDHSWKMDVRREYSNIINKLATGSSEFSKAEQETLAIIAFKQPIKQSVVIKIRGNKAYDHISNFAKLGLIRKKKTGHTYELTLSDEFYDYFNVDKSGKIAEQ